MESLGPPPLKHPGCGTGNGKVVVDELDVRQVAVKDLCKCQANLVRLLAIILGKQMAHLQKLVDAKRGFGSGPSEKLLQPSVEKLHGGVLKPLSLLGPLVVPGPFLCLSSLHWVLPLPLLWPPRRLTKSLKPIWLRRPSVRLVWP